METIFSLLQKIVINVERKTSRIYFEGLNWNKKYIVNSWFLKLDNGRNKYINKYTYTHMCLYIHTNFSALLAKNILNTSSQMW